MSNHTVYILRSEDGRLYKGMTNSLARRLREHRSGHTRTTSTMDKLEVVYTEHYTTRDEARAREVYLKSDVGRRFLKVQMGL